jgi:lipid A 3-O-deacylase
VNRPTLALLLSLLAIAATRGADEPVPSDTSRLAGTFTFYLENDYFGGTDRHYTNGLKLSWLSSDLSDWRQAGWRQRFAEALPFVNRPDGQKNLGLAFGQNIYTPQDQDAAVPNPTDRPYAGWSYLEFTFLSKTERIADTLAIQLGMVGRHSYAKDVQRVVHKWINSSDPQGWDYQLKDEFGVNLIYERRWRLYGRAFGNALGADLVPHAGFSLGNVQTYANAGASVRLGFNLPSDFGVQLIRPGGAGGNAPLDDNDPRINVNRRWSLFVFASGDGRAVARDIFLDGNTFKDSPSVDKRPFVADLSYGVGVNIGNCQITLTQVYRTREFETQPFKYNEFGSLTISCAF